MRLNKVPHFDNVYDLTSTEQLMLGYWGMCVESGTWNTLEECSIDPVMKNNHNLFRKEIKRNHNKFYEMFGINVRSLAPTSIHLAMCIYMNGFGIGYQSCSDEKIKDNAVQGKQL